mgnify:CR=1 FL=1
MIYMTCEAITHLMSVGTMMRGEWLIILGASGEGLKVNSSQLQFQKLPVLEIFEVMLEYQIFQVALLK